MLAETEIDQQACRVWGQLDAGASFLQPFGLLENNDAKAIALERQRRGQAADAGTGNDDGARGRQSTPSRGKFRRRCRATRIPPAAPRAA